MCACLAHAGRPLVRLKHHCRWNRGSVLVGGRSDCWGSCLVLLMTAQASFNVARRCAQDCSLQQSFPVIHFCGGGLGKYGIEVLFWFNVFGAGLRGGEMPVLLKVMNHISHWNWVI